MFEWIICIERQEEEGAGKEEEVGQTYHGKMRGGVTWQLLGAEIGCRNKQGSYEEESEELYR